MTAAEAWAALWRGQLAVRSVHDEGNARALTLKPSTSSLLARRQAAVVWALGWGWSEGSVSAALGLVRSTVRAHALAGGAKIGLTPRRLRTLLPRHLHQADGSALPSVPPPCPPDAAYDETTRRLSFALVLPGEPVELPVGLSRAERQILRHVLDGKGNRDIAAARGVSARTVANQLSAVYRKCGATGRYDLDPALRAFLKTGAR